MSARFHPLTLAAVERETASAVSLRFAVPDELKPLFAFKPGQHVTLRATVEGKEVRRNYSLCAAPDEGVLKVTVKQIPGGVFSGWANTALEAGASIDVMPPHGSFTWAFQRNAARHYVAFAGGSGITPIFSLLKTALREEPDSRFTLVYGNRSADDIIFLEALAALKNRHMARLEVVHVLSEEEQDIPLLHGLLDRGKCDEILDTLVAPDTVDAFFICGPGLMMEAVEGALLARDVPRQHILIERFTVGRPSAAQTADAARLQETAAGRTLMISLDGRRRKVAFDARLGNILDSAHAAGMAVPYACKAGVCATCRARLTSGKVDMKACYGLTQDEVAAGYVLTCQAVPLTDDVALDYDG
ncbi:MAG: 1,2-phenylacetyl-CoA epoxidase subunit PaaE [Pseudomonadota bacterium]